MSSFAKALESAWGTITCPRCEVECPREIVVAKKHKHDCELATKLGLPREDPPMKTTGATGVITHGPARRKARGDAFETAADAVITKPKKAKTREPEPVDVGAGFDADEPIDGLADLRDDEPGEGNLYEPSPTKQLAEDADAALEALRIPLAKLVPSPHNTRKTFPQESIDELAASLASVGQTMLVKVLPAFNGRYEIVDGERRYRAAQQIGWKTLQCVVEDVGAGDAVTIDLVRFEANRHREDLNPIDEAKAFDRFLKPKADGGHGLTQTELAKRTGVSQAQISNRVRLLRLPAKFQAAVISAEISVEVARSLAAWCDVPSVLKAIESRKPDHMVDTYDVRRVVNEATFSLGGLPEKVIQKHRDALKPRKWEEGHYSYWVATGDLALAKQLSEEQQKKNVAKWNKQADQDSAKSAAESEAEAAKRKAQVYNKKLFRYVAEWHKAALLKRLETPQAIGPGWPAVLWRWVLFFSTCRDGAWERENNVESQLKVKAKGDHFSTELVKKLLDLKPEQDLPPLLREWFDVNFESFNSPVKPWEIIEFAKQAGVDMANDWRPDDLFIGLHSAEQLVALWKELGFAASTGTSIPDGCQRKFAVEKFVAAIAANPNKKRYFPKCLKNVEPVSLT